MRACISPTIFSSTRADCSLYPRFAPVMSSANCLSVMRVTSGLTGAVPSTSFVCPQLRLGDAHGDHGHQSGENVVTLDLHLRVFEVDLELARVVFHRLANLLGDALQEAVRACRRPAWRRRSRSSSAPCRSRSSNASRYRRRRFARSSAHAGRRSRPLPASPHGTCPARLFATRWRRPRRGRGSPRNRQRHRYGRIPPHACAPALRRPNPGIARPVWLRLPLADPVPVPARPPPSPAQGRSSRDSRWPRFPPRSARPWSGLRLLDVGLLEHVDVGVACPTDVFVDHRDLQTRHHKLV